MTFHGGDGAVGGVNEQGVGLPELSNDGEFRGSPVTLLELYAYAAPAVIKCPCFGGGIHGIRQWKNTMNTDGHPHLPSQHPIVQPESEQSSGLAHSKSNTFMMPWTPSKQWKNTMNTDGHPIFHRSTPLFSRKSERSSGRLAHSKSNMFLMPWTPSKSIDQQIGKYDSLHCNSAKLGETTRHSDTATLAGLEATGEFGSNPSSTLVTG
ncbi:hypothetical protein THAOC_06391 [Thalassiosira oceanica]|uniref:Uncharacterized protein n=1 Tax=Thalassiosira oceanica TaxID=159749 RepID=K0TLS9_THAOC|nr:hypothetical protein THAOC_06391 [Thalassiosira oceanica]|eukprot:EJK72112.1 hypothetical protein THAOC_06391 [Thalassiosira oceanica]